MWGGSVPLPTEGEVLGEYFAIFELKKASFGAFWD